MLRAPLRLLPLAVATLLSLAACGGGSGSSTTTTTYTLTSATAVLGQSTFTGASANAGGAVDAMTVSQPLGGATGGGTVPFFLADYGNNRVLGFNQVPTATNTPASFVLGQADFTHNAPGSGPGLLALPYSAWIGGGKLVVADSGNNRVLIWNTVPTSNVAPDVVIGQADFNASGAGLSASALSTPSAAVIANGRLFVVDQGNNRVLIWNTVPTVNGTPADIVLGQADFTSNGSAVAQNRLYQPTGLWSDGYRLLVADTGNNRVLYWTAIPATSSANANFVIGQSTFTYSTNSASAQTMNTPSGVSSDGTRVFVADTGNNRVLIFNAFPIANSTAADIVLGQENFTHTMANVDNGNSTNPQDDTPQVTAITARTLNHPTGVYYASGHLYVTDRGNNRVMLFAE